MICLQILQSCLGYINTLMIQDTLAEPEWADKLGDADRRGLTPRRLPVPAPGSEVLALALDTWLTEADPPPQAIRKLTPERTRPRISAGQANPLEISPGLL
jgi:hypothetical protein